MADNVGDIIQLGDLPNYRVVIKLVTTARWCVMLQYWNGTHWLYLETRWFPCIIEAMNIGYQLLEWERAAKLREAGFEDREARDTAERLRKEKAL